MQKKDSQSLWCSPPSKLQCPKSKQKRTAAQNRKHRRRRSDHLRERVQLPLGEDEPRVPFNGGRDGLLDDGGEARAGVARRKGQDSLL